MRSEPTRPVYTKLLPRPAFIQIGLPASPFVPSTPPMIAGNEPAERVAKLQTFWREITANPLLDWTAAAGALAPKATLPRALFNQFSAACALVAGAPGFFSLRQPAPWLHPDGSLEGTSFYETSRLKSTLERLVDFDRINAGGMRFSVGAVNVRTGNLVSSTMRRMRSGPST